MALASILGPRAVTIKAKEGLQLNGVAQLPIICPRGINNDNHTSINANSTSDGSSAVSLFYSWFVDRVVNGSSVREPANDVIVQNRDPRRLVIAPYSMRPGEHYVVTMMVQVMADDDFVELSAVNCSVEVAVASGRVLAVLSGGDRRQVAVGTQLSVDAGPSYDEDLSPLDGWLLGFQWSCETTVFLGNVDVATAHWSKCPFAMNTSTSPSLLVVPSNTLSAGSTYIFHVTVISADGRRCSDPPASAQITAVAAAVSSSSGCLIKARSGARVNADQQLVLPGEVLLDGSTHQGVKAVWSVSVSAGKPWALGGDALTPLEKIMVPMPTQFASTSQSFPLAVSPWVFAKAPGRTLTFRLTAQPLLTAASSSSSPSPSVFSEVVLTVNAPPIGGFMVVLPARGGSALSTLFTLASVGWTDDVDDVPLHFSFQYQLSPSLPLLDIAGPSAAATTSSMLPAGLNTSGLSLAVVVVGRVVDAFQAAANASAEVMVREATAGPTSTTAFLAAGLQAGLVASDADQTLRTVNLAASALYRHPASVHDTTTANVTTTPSTCSGHGVCSFVDVAGNPITTLSGMSLVGTSGTKTPPCAVCDCSDGYGGADCSLSPAELTMRDAARRDMCSALVELTSSQDRSASLFDALLRSLSIAFDPYEVRSDDGRVACSYVLRFLTNVLREGLVPPPSAARDLLFAQVVSSFLEVYRLPQGSIADDAGAAAVIESHVRAALGALTSSLRSRIIAGQLPLTVAAANVRAIVSYGLQRSDSIASTNHPNVMVEMHAITSTPHIAGAYPSFAQTATKLTVDSSQLGSACGISTADALTTVLQVRADMRKRHANQTSSSASAAATEKKVSPSYQLSITNAAASTAVRSGPMREGQGQGPAYYITMPFAAPQDFFNRTARRRNDVDQASSPGPVGDLNVSSVLVLVLPRCATFDGEKYSPCRHCNISSLTSVNVTFACYDIAALCQATSLIVAGGSSIESNGVREGPAEGYDVEPYLSSALDASADPRSRALAPKGGKKGGGGGGKKGGAGRAASKHRSAANNKNKNDDLSNTTNVMVSDELNGSSSTVPYLSIPNRTYVTYSYLSYCDEIFIITIMIILTCQVDDGNYPPNDDLATNNAHLDMTEFTVLVTTHPYPVPYPFSYSLPPFCNPSFLHLPSLLVAVCL